MRQPTALEQELRNIVDHAEALLEALVDEGDAKLAQLRERVFASVGSAKARLDDLVTDAEQAGTDAAESWDRWIEDNPWTAFSIGAALGLIAGWLLRSGRRGAAESSPATEENPS